MENKLLDIFLKQIDNTLKTVKKPDPWLTGTNKFNRVKLLSIDERGRNGQEFLQQVFKLAGFRTIGDNEKTGDWDIKINNWRIEVKTACLDRNGKFQHESVHKTNNFDFIFFLDVAPNDIYFSCCAYSDIPWEHLHLRGKAVRATGSGYKWDISYKTNNPRLPKYHGLVESVEDMVSIFKQCLNAHPELLNN